MYTAPALYRPPSVMISPFSYESLGVSIRQAVSAAPTSQAWPTNNLAIAYPFSLPCSTTFVKAFAWNGTNATGNMDIGVYDTSYGLLASIGSTARSGTSTIQEVDITDFTLPRGHYYIAIALSSTTGTIFAATTTARGGSSIGAWQQASALALPSTATPALHAQTVMPFFGISQRTLVA